MTIGRGKEQNPLTVESLIAFRDLPGLARIECLLLKIDQHPNPKWAPEHDDLLMELDRLSRDFFGITEAETTHTEHQQDGIATSKALAWDRIFSLKGLPNNYPQDLRGRKLQSARSAWEALGWDVANIFGQIHPLLGYFHKQMILASLRLKGRLPTQEMSDEEARRSAETWGASLVDTLGRPSRRTG